MTEDAPRQRTQPPAAKEPAPAEPSGDFFGHGFSLERYPLYLMAHVDQLYTIEMESALGGHKFTRPKWRTLASLMMRNGLSIGEIAEITLFKLSTLSRVAERLEREGLVTRRPRESDNRITEVSITDKGREAFREIREVSRRQYARATADLSDDDIDHLCRTLRQMMLNLQKSPYA